MSESDGEVLLLGYLVLITPRPTKGNISVWGGSLGGEGRRCGWWYGVVLDQCHVSLDRIETLRTAMALVNRTAVLLDFEPKVTFSVINLFFPRLVPPVGFDR